MAQWTSDGTHDPGPPPLHADPLSGLVTGRRHEQDAMRVRVVEPTMPDISAVREAMQAVLDDESELMLAGPAAAPKPEPDNQPVPAPRPEAETGPPTNELPKPPAPTAEAATKRAPERARQHADPAQPPSIPAQRTVAAPATPQRRGFSPGIAAIIALLAVIAVLAIVAVASLIDTIASLFS